MKSVLLLKLQTGSSLWIRAPFCWKARHRKSSGIRITPEYGISSPKSSEKSRIKKYRTHCSLLTGKIRPVFSFYFQIRFRIPEDLLLAFLLPDHQSYASENHEEGNNKDRRKFLFEENHGKDRGKRGTDITECPDGSRLHMFLGIRS